MLSSTVRAPVRLVLPLVVLAVTAPLTAQEPPRQEQQREHVVRRGDTLWDLARLYLGNPFLWPSIFEVNRSVVENPHWIYPQERLIIPPLLQQQAQEPAEPIGRPMTSYPPAPPPPAQQQQQQPDPPAPVMAMVDLRRPVVPVAEYIALPWLSTTAQNEVVAQIAQSRDPASQRDVLATMLHPAERVYLRNLATKAMAGGPGVYVPEVGDSLVAVRFGRSLGGAGRVIEPVALLRIDTVLPNVTVARMVRQLGDTRVGDAVLLLNRVPQIGTGEPEPLSDGVRGQLLEFLSDEPLHGTTDIGFISLGVADGVGIGDEFAVYVPARQGESDAVRLPPTDVATLRVVKVGEKTATVRVLAVSSTALRAGLPVRMIRKMP